MIPSRACWFGTYRTGGPTPNRAFASRWGSDAWGRSPSPSSEPYRGPSANSEPETRALDALEKRVRFAYGINY
uniref:M14 family zinc carboxypeptidase n=1 Tax=Streptomyces seoulensis TaxID=73044 RepID=UPI003B8A857B